MLTTENIPEIHPFKNKQDAALKPQASHTLRFTHTFENRTVNLWVAATREAKIGGSIYKHFIVGAGVWWHIMVWAWIFNSVPY